MSKKSLTLFAALGIAAAAGAAYAVRWWFDGADDASRHSPRIGDPDRDVWRSAGAMRADRAAMSDWDDDTDDLFEANLTRSERGEATKAKIDDSEVADMAAAVLTDADLSEAGEEPKAGTKRSSSIRKQQSPSEVPVAGR